MSTTANLEVLTKAINKSVHQFFETMFSIKVEDGELIFSEEPRPDIAACIKPEIVGVIGISGSIKGSVSTHHSMEFVEKIGQLMMGTAVTESEVNDVAGEISNISTGGAKTIAAALGLNFEISCPTVIRGKDAHVEPAKKTIIAYQTFKVDGLLLLVTSIIAE